MPVRPRRVLVNLALLGALVAVAACNGDSETSDGQTGNATPPARTLPDLKQLGASKRTCPAALTGKEGPSTCKLVFTGADMTPCENKANASGGYGVSVYGISCQDGRSLLLALGCNFPNYAEARALICRPTLATGPLSDPTPTEPTGWTCWAGFDPKDPVGIRNVCWRGSAVLVFNVG